MNRYREKDACMYVYLDIYIYVCIYKVVGYVCVIRPGSNVLSFIVITNRQTLLLSGKHLRKYLGLFGSCYLLYPGILPNIYIDIYKVNSLKSVSFNFVKLFLSHVAIKFYVRRGTKHFYKFQ